MNVSLTPELNQFIDQKVNSGMYTSASEVIRESLRIMRSYEQLQQSRINELNNAIELGMNQSKRHDMVSANDVYDRLLTLIKKIENNK